VEFLFDPAAGTSEVGITPREVGGVPPRPVAPRVSSPETLCTCFLVRTDTSPAACCLVPMTHEQRKTYLNGFRRWG
jgi:hypothetical protein